MALDERTRELGETIFEAADSLKAQEIRALDVTDIESYTDLVFISSGSSSRQVQAIADRVIDAMLESHKIRPLGVEGFDAAEWILIDFGEIVVHVFFDEVRPEYKLEEMWPDVNSIDADNIPDFLSKRPGDVKEKA